MTTTKISQREAHRLRSRVKQLEAKINYLREGGCPGVLVRDVEADVITRGVVSALNATGNIVVARLRDGRLKVYGEKHE